MRNPSVTFLGSEFDDFLFAPIGEDAQGMRLSVLSALARQDLDPWQEAATLAGLPGDAATRKLAILIAGLPDGPWSSSDPVVIAARLIRFLPGRAVSAKPSPRSSQFGPSLFGSSLFGPSLLGPSLVDRTGAGPAQSGQVRPDPSRSAPSAKETPGSGLSRVSGPSGAIILLATFLAFEVFAQCVQAGHQAPVVAASDIGADPAAGKTLPPASPAGSKP